MKKNNYNTRTRDLGKAGNFLLKNALENKYISYLAYGSYLTRWNNFVKFCISYDVKKMEEINQNFVVKYANHLFQKVENDEFKINTAKNYLSAVNVVMDLATLGKWQSVYPKSCDMQKRSFIRTTIPPCLDYVHFMYLVDYLEKCNLNKIACIILLARMFGLRTKESSLLNAHQALSQAYNANRIKISKGTKNGQLRYVPILSQYQIDVLKKVSKIQGKNICIIPAEQNWITWCNNQLKIGREHIKSLGIPKYHDLRATYACLRYSQLTNHPAPVVTRGKTVKRKLDNAARTAIAEELGHHRTEILASYIGGRR